MKTKTLNILLALVLIVSCILVVPVPVAAAAAWYVDPAGTDDNSHGLNPGASAFKTITFALSKASSGETINVAAGTYHERISLKDGVQLLGSGFETTTIDGDAGGTVVTAEFLVLPTRLEGFTITNGNGSYGGGMHNMYGTSPVVANCLFSYNSSGHGAGMCNEDGSSPTVINCVFAHNLAGSGGGIANYAGSSPHLINCLFFDNSASNFGGGMLNAWFVSCAVNNCTFSDNSAPFGSGIVNLESNPTVTNCILWGDIGNGEIYSFEEGGLNPSISTVTYSDVQGAVVYPGTGNINEDPLFKSPLTDDFRLPLGSPCIDTGDNTGAPTDDLEGNPRPIDGDNNLIAVTDMGAYEYHAEPARQGVGGEVVSANKIYVLLPWLILMVGIISSGVVFKLVRRKIK